MKNFRKKIWFILLFLTIYSLKAQNEFIFIWQATDQEKRLDIPTNNSYFYNYTINWGDGSVNNNVAGDTHHTYAVNGNYTITISGTFPAINTSENQSNRYKQQMLSIEQWGNIQWRTMKGAFNNMSNLVINTNDTPDLSLCLNMEEMFSYCSNINNGSHNMWNLWNTSTVTNMEATFANSNFSRDIGNWNVSNVVNMSYIFSRSSFNQPINNWNVSNVKDMEAMFFGNLVFNQNIENWNVGNVENMSKMFQSTNNFNQPLNNWNVSSVTDMSYMFSNATFNLPINNWNVGNVTNMNYMFGSSSHFSNFNQPLNNWNVSSVTNMSHMFDHCHRFNQDISNWNVGNVTEMVAMFATASDFNQPIGNWNVSKVTTLASMFVEATNFNQPLNNWNVSNVENMFRTFSSCNFNQPLNNWNVSKVSNMDSMFSLNNDFNHPIGNWDVSNVTSMREMFSNSIFNQPIGNWNTIKLEIMFGMFRDSQFNQPIGNWNTSLVTDLSHVFDDSEFDQDISMWNVESVAQCINMFKDAALSAANYDALLIGWNSQNLRQFVIFNGGSSRYLSNDAENARQNMIANDRWSITDGGKLQTFTWTGAVSTDWNTAGNWDTGEVPSSTDDVVLADVANAPRINFNQNYTVKDLTVHDVLTLKNNASLTVTGNLDQRNTIQVESFVTGSASFILTGNQTNVNPGNLLYLRYVSGNAWHLFGSPVINQDIDAFAAATALAEGQGNNRGIGFHNANGVQGWSYYQNGANDTGGFTTGKGYSIQTSGAAFLRFEGELKDDNLTNYPILDNPSKWNLMSNPYPASISANTNANAVHNFLTENADQLDPAFANIYLWNPNTNSYDPIGNGLGARYIPPGQGFFVRAKDGGGQININKTMLTHQSGDLFLKNEQLKAIEIKLNSDSKTSKSTIVFNENMTSGLDITFDAAVFNGDENNFYTYSKLIDDSSNLPFAIQFLPEINTEEFIIPLGVKSTDFSKLNLSFNFNIPNDLTITLEDRKLNTFTNINEINRYDFTYKTDDELNRFFLHVQNQALSSEEFNENKITIYKDSNSSVFINGVSDGLLNIYTITGKRIVKNRKVNKDGQQVQLSKLATGIYLFEVKTDTFKTVKKLIF